MKRIQTEWGEVINLGETKEFSCSLIRIMPGQKILKHLHNKMREIEIIIKGDAIVNGKKFSRDSFMIWEPGEAHEHANLSNQVLEIVCLAWPPYDPLDEIRL